MEAALGWLGDIFRALLRFMPHIVLVRSTHDGIKFKAGRDVVQISCNNGIPLPRLRRKFPWIWLRRSGVHIYWAIVSECEIVPVKRQTTNLVAQYLVTKDRKTIGCSGILVYEVVDVVRLLTECYDYEDTIRDLSLAAIKTVIIKHDFDDLLLDAKDVDKQLTHTLRENLKRFGIRTIRVTLSDFSPARIMGLWGAGNES